MHEFLNRGKQLKILKGSHEFLRKKITKELSFPLTDEQRNLILTTGQTMKSNIGFYTRVISALSANQVHLNFRFFVMINQRYSNPYRRLRYCLNPKIEKFYKQNMSSLEGCVSYEEILGETIRDNKIDVSYKDLNGKQIKETLIGQESAAFQHEIDHLNGITVITKELRLLQMVTKKNQLNFISNKFCNFIMKYSLMISLLIITLLTLQVSTICSSGCLKCDGDNKCLVCDATSLYVLVENTCQKQELQFCLLAYEIGICQLCYPGYYLEVNNRCVTNPSGLNEIDQCDEYETFHHCKRCNKHYYLSEDNRSCLKVQDKILYCQEYLNEKQCKICEYGIVSLDKKQCLSSHTQIDNCLYYFDKPHCEECEEGYLLNNNNYIVNVSLYYSSFIYLFQRDFFYQQMVLDLPICQKITPIENCEEINVLTLACKKCKEGYYLDGDKNDFCYSNPFDESSIVRSQIPYCLEIKSFKQSVNNQVVTLYKCLLCYEGYYISAGQRKCTAHTKKIPNCKIYSQQIPDECIKCVDGYYRQDLNSELYLPVFERQKCHLRQQNFNCKTPDELSLECKECIDPTYIKYYNKQHCGPMIPRCLIYNLDQLELTCKYCEKNYYYDQTSKQCLENSGVFDPYCSLYNSNKECEQCFFGFYYNKLEKVCESNSLEYQYNSQCKEYEHSDINTCKDCQNLNTLVQIDMTCKLFSDDLQRIENINQNNTFKISHCDVIEMDTEQFIKCREALNPTQQERSDAGCQENFNTNDVCKTYFVNTSTQNPVLNSFDDQKQQNLLVGEQDSILCDIFQPSAQGTNNVCQQCYPTVFKKDSEYLTSNICTGTMKLLFCPEEYTNPTFSNLCDRVAGKCGYIKYDREESDGSFTTIEIDTCDVSGLPQCSAGSSYVDENNAVQEYCSVYPGMENCPAALYKRDVENEVILTTEGLCVENRGYTGQTCLLEKDSKCVLCIQGYKPDQFKIYSYQKDQVQSYDGVILQDGYSQLKNCIEMIINTDGTKECNRCDLNKGYRLNPSTKFCVNCLGDGKVGASDNIECIFYSLQTQEQKQSSGVDKGLCNQVTSKDNPICFACFEGYIPMWDISVTNQYDVYEYWRNESKEITFVKKKVKTWSTDFCKLIDKNIFNQKLSNNDKVGNCGWGIGSQELFFCISCKFGYNGEYGEFSSTQSFIEGCDVDQTCDSTQHVIIQDPSIRNMSSCHYCLSSSQVPTLFYYFESFVSLDNITWVYSAPNESSIKNFACHDKSFYIPSDCLIQVKIFRSIGVTYVRDKMKAYSDRDFEQEFTSQGLDIDTATDFMVCALCKPKYKPTYVEYKIGQTFNFPSQFTFSCTYITNCKSSLTANICEVCDSDYEINDDGTECLPIQDKFTSTVDGNQVVDTAAMSFFTFCNKILVEAGQRICTQCKEGYIQTDKCIPYSVDGCKYYQVPDGSKDTVCVQTKGRMEVNYNVLERKVVSDYKVPQTNCIEVTPGGSVTNCRFYKADGTCMLCNDGYQINNSGTQCSNDKIFNCEVQIFPESIVECSVCKEGYHKEKKYLALEIPENKQVETIHCIEDSVSTFNLDVEFCLKKHEGQCVQCIEGYAPVKINGVFPSLCVDIQISKLCEEWDLEMFNEQKIISCKKCKKLSEIVQKATDTPGDGQFKLNQYDFFSANDFRNAINSQGQITYTDILAKYPHIRAALVQKQNEFYCRPYKGITNCEIHDDKDLNSTFQCQQCRNEILQEKNDQGEDVNVNYMFYLQSQQCIARSMIDVNCLTYSITQDKCDISFGQSNYVVSFSTYDLYVIEKNPPEYTSSLLEVKIIENCEIYESLTQCKICKPGYYLYDNLCLIVEVLVPDCDRYYTEGICQECTGDLYLFQNKCVPIYVTNCFSFLTNTKCDYCPPQYPILKYNGSCEVNKEIPNCKIYLSLNSCMECEDEFLNSKGHCISAATEPAIPNCKLQIEGQICQECEQGYSMALDSKSCNQNPLNDRTCKKFNNEQICSLCELGYYFNEGYCYPCTTGFNCALCEPSNPSKCALCRSGYFMNNNFQCIQETDYQISKVRTTFQDTLNKEELDEVISQRGLQGLQGHSDHQASSLTMLILYLNLLLFQQIIFKKIQQKNFFQFFLCLVKILIVNFQSLIIYQIYMSNKYLDEDNFLDQDEEEILEILYPSNQDILTYDDLQQNAKLLKVNLSNDFLKQMFKEADVNFDNKLSQEEFKYYLHKKTKFLKDTFNLLDMNDTGYITKNELKKTFVLLNYKINDEQFEYIFQKLDKNNDNKISFKEFLYYHYQIPFQSIQNIFDTWFTDSIDIGSQIIVSTNQPTLNSYQSMIINIMSRGISAGIARTLTAPLDRVRITMQGQEDFITLKNTFKAVYQKQGILGFYRGNLTNVVKVIPETSIRYFCFDLFTKKLNKENSDLTFKERFRIAAMSSFISHTLIYPLEMVRTRLVIQSELKGIRECFNKIIQEEGYLALYRGLLASTISIVPYSAILISSYVTIRNFYASKQQIPSVHSLIISATISSSLASFMTYPLTLLRTKLQLNTDQAFFRKQSFILNEIRRIYSQQGVKGFYQGIIPHYMKTVPSVVVSFYYFEKIRNYLTETFVKK